MEIHFRKVDIKDLEVLRQLSRSTFIDTFEKDNAPGDFKAYLDAAFSKEQLSNELLNPASEFYLMETDKEAVGYLKLNEGKAQSEWIASNVMELERIYVKSIKQGKGIGQKALNFAMDKAARAGKMYLWLGVWEKNRKAIQFYQRHGFVKFGTHPYYIGKDKQTDWLMKKSL